MLYRPKFCCECGIKVEREKWNLLTDRRFCENCEIEKTEVVWLPKLSALVLGIFAFFGIGSFFTGAEKSPNIVKAGFISANTIKKLPTNANSVNQTAVQNSAITDKAVKNLPENKQTETKNILSEANLNAAESVYFCGAKTKKGTACTRRVRGGGRCWQHSGQTAMFPDKKLLISP